MSNENRSPTDPSKVQQEPLQKRDGYTEDIYTPPLLPKAPSSLEGSSKGAYNHSAPIEGLPSLGTIINSKEYKDYVAQKRFKAIGYPVEFFPFRVGIDLDGVGYNWDSTARYLMETHFGYNLREADTWDYLKQNISKDAWKWLWNEGVREKGLYRHGHMLKGFKDGVQAISDYGFIPVIITSRPKEATTDTLEWLAFHRIPTTEVHILGPLADKTEVRCDLYVDDGPKNIDDFQEASVPYLIWHQPWNVQCEGTRARSWSEVLSHAKEIDRDGRSQGRRRKT